MAVSISVFEVVIGIDMQSDTYSHPPKKKEKKEKESRPFILASRSTGNKLFFMVASVHLNLPFILRESGLGLYYRV